MMCKWPFTMKSTGRDVPLPCGQCLPCRINKRRVWTHRMMLERSTNEECSFLTVTYSDENLPGEFFNEENGVVYAPNSVSPYEHKKFIAKLRINYRRLTGKKIRFFMCGEYGEKTARPHYHYALFGFPPCSGTGPVIIGRKFHPCQCPECSFVTRIWGKGHCYLGTLTQHSAQYVCGYVTKKLTNENNQRTQEILNGRYPEFCRSSRRPGIGYDAAVQYGLRLKPYVTTDEDIPPYLIHEGRKWPLGRYLYAKVREAAGLPPLEEGEAIRRYKEGLLDLFESKKPVGLSSKALAAGLPDIALKLLNAQSALSLEQRQFHNDINKKGI